MSSFFDSFRSAIQNTGTKTNKNPQRIKAAELKEWLEQENPPLVLDVRTSEEYRQAHIPGSKLLPVQQLPSMINNLAEHTDTPVVVYCASGARSGQAARFLAKNGFNEVYDMGGIFSWPYKVVR
ncbi:MAG: rhodanese-like domain-containing protein [Clostridiaceae bacterium]|nr:rhodanese-like domain-containing protein [Clostridiaceae bacterium]